MGYLYRCVVVCSLWANQAAASPLARPAFELAREPVAASGSDHTQSRVLYLNRHGAELRPGRNDSRTQTSSIVSKPTAMRGWNASTADWAATVTCMRELWSRFDVEVTDVDPGTTPHIEALFGGAPGDVGMAANIGGVSPFALDCGVIENSIVFAFTDNLPHNPRVVCEVMAQEIGHSFGLDHEMNAADPMTYLSYAKARAFQDADAACGEHAARPCGISGHVCRATQNSVQLLTQRLGAAGGDHTAPVVVVTSPADRATVAPGFAVTTTASDDIAVTAVTFYVDGEVIATLATGPFAATTDPGLAAGPHTITVEAIDARGNLAVAAIDVVVDHDPASGGGLFGIPAGCSVGGGPGGGFALAVAVVVWRRRRRRA